MNRREFVERAGATLAGAALVHAPPTPPPELKAWTWVHGNGDDAAAWSARFARLRAAGITGVLVGGGDTAQLAAAARREGLAFHAWTWILNRSGDAWVKTNHPEWFSVSRNGDSSLTKPPYVGYYQWLCPSREPVREYLEGVVRNIAQVPAVDAVHLDYIRHPDVILPRGLWAKYNLVQDHEMPEFDFCYCDVCREKFRSQSGTDPLTLPDPTVNRAWREFRWNSVSELVKRLATAVHAERRLISAAVFPTPAIARRLVRQAWDTWPLDMVFPMLYHKFHEEDIAWIGRGAHEGVAAIRRGEPLYAGVYLPDLDPAALALAIAAARHGGAAGFSTFEMGGLTDQHLAVIRRELR